MQNVVGLILGGGRGARLYPLTKWRSEPAVPIAGKYRLIDIPVSNCINSGIGRLYVVTQYLSVSLHQHLAHTFTFDPFGQSFVEILPAQQTNEASDWYRGTADAIRQNIPYLTDEPAREVLILSGDQVYRMDFRQLIGTHRAGHAEATIAVLPVTEGQASRLGIVRLDERDRIIQLVEKPQTDEQLQALRLPTGFLERRGIEARGREYLANMGIYLFNRDLLFTLLQAEPLATDLVTELFVRRVTTHPIQAHLFDGYWADVGTIPTYHEASLALAGDHPPFDFNSPEGVIYTRMRYLPASRLSTAAVRQSLISDGCTVQEGTSLERCVVGVRSHIGRHVTMRATVFIGADDYETPESRTANRREGLPDLGVGDGAVIENAILDKDCRIGRNVRIVNERRLREAEGANYVIREGIVIIPNGAVVPDGTVI